PLLSFRLDFIGRLPPAQEGLGERMAVLENAEAVVPKLPIWQTTKAAYRDTFGNLGVVATAAAVPFGLSVLVDIALPEDAAGAALAVIRLFLTTAVVALFEIAWLRRLLLEESTARPGLVPPIGRRFRVFVGYSLLLTVLYVPAIFFQVVLVETAQASPVTFGIFIFILYVTASYLIAR
ncbi:hypothetical protein ACKGJN_16735, partial [Gillisia sp. Q332]|uniref:hypothetical protein n=1 Tax=Gillisia xinjiangensis TaxID=3384765 RepID=UPI0039199F4E